MDDPVPASAPWAAAPALQISPRLRRTGSYERRGKPSRITDRSEQRRHLVELAAREAAETAAARAELATERPTRLSDVATLPTDAFRLFLGLLGDALTALVPGRREVAVTTSDGSMAVRLTVLEGGSRAEIVTPDGVFRGPDHLVHIVDLTVSERAELTA
jgi:uncharacterized protein (TIGR02677 family)